MVPVMKDCVKKKPEIQYERGLPSEIQVAKKRSRATRSDTHEASGFNEGYAFFAHSSGTCPLKSAPATASSSL
eukprot:CAMPEP_0119397128 /NCGR_PEP_ID=MMETSP1334-20130426/139729_1 /TAXON_ID=127549 /ORGANISM="Calcidiscus leptoporus, Strain RCC1130" /LENGTH=72 /DNA_ID=CAMNT_0007420927 /DNA_START=48 /DNA_END=263 /DNA_ORIENTATION=-